MSASLAPAAWFLAERATAAGESVVLTVVVSHTVHSPGTAGASHAITQSGERAGTIGGGIMEARLERDSASWIAQGSRQGSRARVVELHHSRDTDGAQSGMICAGRQTNVSVLLGAADHEALCAPVAEALRQSGNGFVHASDAGFRWEPTAKTPGSPWRLPVAPSQSVLIVGGGHCGAALASLVATLGWRVDVVDTRSELRTLPQLDGIAHVHVVSDYQECAGYVRDDATAVVVMTADFPSDVRALDAILRRERLPRWVGVMGSESKRERIWAELRKAAHPADRIDAVRSPIGIPMKSDTPAEIAISVAGELLGLAGAG